jgi:hypothetical protein
VVIAEIHVSTDVEADGPALPGKPVFVGYPAAYDFLLAQVREK